MFDRLIKLIGSDKLEEIDSKRILLIGVGGVGSSALEALVRNGFNHITVVDYDVVDITNLNRQLITDSSNIGELKVNAAYKRAKLIRKDIIISTQNIKVTSDNLLTLIDSGYDYIIDACDDIKVKYELIYYSMKMNFKLIESMGTAKKIDPSKLSITTLDKTYNDPLARKLRSMIRKNHINMKVNVISSSEVPKKIPDKGTCSLVPNYAGILLVSYIMNDILNK